MADQNSHLAERHIGFLGGGSMANALIRGLLHSQTVRPDQIRASDTNPERNEKLAAEYGIETTRDNEALAAWANIVVIEPDLLRLFPDSDAVNRALRSLAEIAERQATGQDGSK